MFKQHTYYIEYWDKYYTRKSLTIKAKNENEAEKKFYKKHFYALIVKISLIKSQL